jgi:Domain of unknown function (DUF1918)
MPEVGDRVRVESSKVGQAVREGVVTEVLGHLLRVRWSSGEESTFTPGPGSVTVIGKTRTTPSKKTAASTKKSATAGGKKTPKSAVAKKNAAPRKDR